MSSKRYESLISNGLVQPLDQIRFHDREAAPVLRRLMAGGDVLPDANQHIAVHEIRNVAAGERGYCQLHRHDCAEINVLLSWERMLFRVVLGDETYTVEAPATIYIPPTLLHSANVIEGTGFYIAILGKREYASTFADAPKNGTWTDIRAAASTGHPLRAADK